MTPFDILILGDFQFPGGTSVAVAHELRALRSTSHTVGLYHVNSADLGREVIGWHQEIERSAVTVVPEGPAAGLRSRSLPAGRGDCAP